MLILNTLARWLIVSFSLTSSAVPVLLVAMAFSLALQIVGHWIFEGRIPAFRGFEAFVTTPFFIALNTLFWFGYKPELRAEIYRKASEWAERVNNRSAARGR